MKKFIAFVLLAVFTVLMGLMFTSCGTRKVAKEETKIVTKVKDTVAESSKKETTTETKKQVAEKTIEKETQKEISAEVKDGETLQVDEFDKNGNHKGTTIFKGSGKAKIKEVEKSKDAEVTIIEDGKEITLQEDNKNASSEGEQTIDHSSKESERTNELDLYLLIGFSLVTFFFLWRLKRKDDQQSM